ncbi:Phosphatidylinositol transfer protein [Spironucleus salmonicida]|uniref:Phosphatidylinositol transfer protein n=1 Tax=Spironucleus salmonicida TaxID=348837 RepID=V6LP27_9EUKA|nr:Phosphatidylinositol transfer protein [Spironucleus salmonicida]|eukprot:EST46355.1 Phosphatidylinositol transfer protein [Spironucleus salmonicida]
MKYFIYQYELPFPSKEYNIAQHYIVGQSEKSTSNSIEILSDELIEMQTESGPQVDLNSHKIIHINRIVPKTLSKLIPSYAEQLDEKSQTRGFEVITTQICKNKPEAFKLIIHTMTFDEKQVKIPSCFTELQGEKKIEIIDVSLNKEMDQLQEKGKINHNNYFLGKQKCYCMKLICIETSIFGKSVIESGIGSKMKKVFINNFKNLISCYDSWKGFDIKDIKNLRQGKGVEQGEEFQDDEK